MEYKGNPQFSCVRTTLAGGLAIGGCDGAVRLYRSSGAKRATTLYTEFHDPIVAIDVSADGRWVLATCSRYLLLISTTSNAGEKTGFESTLRKDNKKNVVRLELSADDTASHGLSEARFTPATFNCGDELGAEEAILTSIGTYIVMWNFAQVKRGKLFNYKIKLLGDRVVKNQFKFNCPEKVLVTLPQTVKVERRIMRSAQHDDN